MKFKIKVRHGEYFWEETYDEPEIKTLEEAKEWSKKIIETYNSEYYKPRRELIYVKECD